MAQGVNAWSTTAASNATADSTINWAEGQSPSSVNDSSRAMMARLAEYRVYTSGKTDTGGSADAYTFSTGDSGHTALSDGYKITFCVSATNTGAATINVDSLGAVALRFHTGVALPAGALITGSIYTATYDSGASEWRLHGAVNVVNTSNQITAANGSAAAPSVTFASDLDTGMYRIGANNLGLAVNGTKIVDVGVDGITVTGDVNLTDDLDVDGDANIDGNAVVDGTLSVGGTQLVSILPLGAALGLVCQNNASTPTTSWDVNADAAVLLDSNGIPKTVTSVDLTINAATTGANALDAGALANNTWYNAFIISNGSTTAGLLSTSATAPTMPSGYTYKLRVNAIKTGSSATFLRVLVRGNKAKYTPVTGSTTTALPQMSSGVQGNPNSGPSFTTVSVSSYVPPTAKAIDLSMMVKDSVAMVVPNATVSWGTSISTSVPAPFGVQQSGVTANLLGEILLEGTDIYYANSNIGVLSCVGWTDAVLAA